VCFPGQLELARRQRARQLPSERIKAPVPPTSYRVSGLCSSKLNPALPEGRSGRAGCCRIGSEACAKGSFGMKLIVIDPSCHLHYICCR
jgi:hypothetical protein